jgi:cytochrome c oxidase subunit II
VRNLRNPLVQIGIWTLGVGSVLSVIVLSVPWLPEEASAQAGKIDTLYEVLSVVSCFVFALVMSILLVSVVHFRRRHNDLSDGEPIHGHTGLEALWTAVPAVLMVGAAVYSALVLGSIEEPKANTRTIEVTGQQFAWTFKYDDGNFRSGELHLVKGTPYHFKLRAKDVIHSFWVPEFRLKKDAVPGMTTDARVTPTRLGSYALVCAELCGLGHSTMRAPVSVTDQASFDRWAEQQKKNQSTVGGTS